MALASHTRTSNGKIQQRISIEIQIHDGAWKQRPKNRATDAYEISSSLVKQKNARHRNKKKLQSFLMTGIEGSNKTNEFADVQEMEEWDLLIIVRKQPGSWVCYGWFLLHSLQRGIFFNGQKSSDDGKNHPNNSRTTRLLTFDLDANSLDAVEHNFHFQSRWSEHVLELSLEGFHGRLVSDFC